MGGCLGGNLGGCRYGKATYAKKTLSIMGEKDNKIDHSKEHNHVCSEILSTLSFNFLLYFGGEIMSKLKKDETDVDRRYKQNPRKMVFQLRMNKDESDLLDMISYATEDTKADVLRKALKMYASVNRGSY